MPSMSKAMNDAKYNRALKPDAQAFDRVELVTIPRFKTSGLSGDEWRISIEARFYRNDRLVHSCFCGHDMESGMAQIQWRYIQAVESGKGFFAGEGDFCDQEGCSNPAIVTLRKRFDYCRDGHKSECDRPSIRRFCELHKTRGDCGLDDSDANYEAVKP